MLIFGMGADSSDTPEGAAWGRTWRGAVQPTRAAGLGGGGDSEPPVSPGVRVGRLPEQNALSSAPKAQTWARAARVLRDAGCCVARNAWDAVIVTAGGVELDYRLLPPGPIKQAWNTLSVDEPDEDFAP